VTTEEYFEATVQRGLTFSWQMKSNIATVTNKVEVLFYDWDLQFLSSVVLYNATTGNPTAWTVQNAFVTPPASSKFAKLKITGANSATAGSTWYDDFQIVPTISKAPSAITSFAASGTWTCPAYVNRIKVRVWGGGAGGTTGQGGGAGGYAEGLVTVVPGTAYTVTVGTAAASGANGNASGFNAVVTASGGIATGAGGTGGGASLSVSFTGGAGNGLALVANGGSCPMGGQGGAYQVAGVAPGGGGGGGASGANGAGSVGRVIVEY
jgi:hypothetical protein